MKYWMAVASREHVLLGVQGGFAQVCHGKCGPLARMKEGDWIIYYSPKMQMGQLEPCQRFTALGQVLDGEPYLFHLSESFSAYRRNIEFHRAEEIAIAPLIEQLSFLPDKKHWGYPFHRGCFSIPEADFLFIRSRMERALE